MAYTTINKGSSYFNTVLYTGTGSNLAITGVGFKPDWVWCKSRSAAEDHTSWDAVRGSTARLSQNTTGVEFVNATQGMQSFDTDGFTCGVSDQYNKSAQTQVSWCWLGANTTVSNTQGTISSTVSANTTSGFSIVSYTGTGAVATVGHGLGVAPNIIIVKQRTAAGNHWVMYNSALPSANYFLYLDSTDAQQTATGFFNNTAPTSSVFTLGTDAQTNGNTNNLIAYCFAAIKGYSKFGSYTGNGSTNGPFIYTGFKPAFIIVKRTDASQDWFMWDSKRTGFNMVNNLLFSNASQAEYTGSEKNIDILSNGFKIRADSTAPGSNASGGTYIYMAFAENPFVSSTFIPTTAR